MTFGPLPEAKSLTVTTPDGVRISAQEWGNPRGPEILFVHPWSQSHLSWVKQLRALAGEFRMVTYDMRGHGYSEKPAEPASYDGPTRLAAELQAVMDQAGLKKPVLVGTSVGGRIICDYLLSHGTGRVRGVNFAASPTKADPSLFHPAGKMRTAMCQGKLWDDIAGTVAFLELLTSKPLPPEEFQVLLAMMMLTPPSVREALLPMRTVYDDMLESLRLPVLVTHAGDDPFLRLESAQFTVAKVRGAKLSVHEGIGHAVQWESPDRFNRELQQFVREAQTQSAP